MANDEPREPRLEQQSPGEFEVSGGYRVVDRFHGVADCEGYGRPLVQEGQDFGVP